MLKYMTLINFLIPVPWSPFDVLFLIIPYMMYVQLMLVWMWLACIRTLEGFWKTNLYNSVWNSGILISKLKSLFNWNNSNNSIHILVSQNNIFKKIIAKVFSYWYECNYHSWSKKGKNIIFDLGAERKNVRITSFYLN